ncbi:hypothetical protein BKA64DRAFT_164063 [Cadophora sp. MPI-SDFR-AT-0126]|nr:hypothetical protein BKA64DRAFT_164063 [Leotiomycetes sp. MPI-SDFR-AT-0126]
MRQAEAQKQVSGGECLSGGGFGGGIPRGSPYKAHHQSQLGATTTPSVPIKASTSHTLDVRQEEGGLARRFAATPERGRFAHVDRQPTVSYKTPSPPGLESTTGSSQDGHSSHGAVTPPDDLDTATPVVAKALRKERPYRVAPRRENSFSSEDEYCTAYAPRNEPEVQHADGWRRPNWRRPQQEDKANLKETKGKEEQVTLSRLPEILDFTFLNEFPHVDLEAVEPLQTPIVPNDTGGHPTRWPGIPDRVPAFGSLSPAELRVLRAKAIAPRSGVVPCSSTEID